MVSQCLLDIEPFEFLYHPASESAFKRSRSRSRSAPVSYTGTWVISFKAKQQKKSTYEFSFVRPRRDDKICGERNNDSYDAFDNKDPDELPSMF